MCRLLVTPALERKAVVPALVSAGGGLFGPWRPPKDGPPGGEPATSTTTTAMRDRGSHGGHPPPPSSLRMMAASVPARAAGSHST